MHSVVAPPCGVARWSLFLEAETLGDARERLLLGQHRRSCALSHSPFALTCAHSNTTLSLRGDSGHLGRIIGASLLGDRYSFTSAH